VDPDFQVVQCAFKRVEDIQIPPGEGSLDPKQSKPQRLALTTSFDPMSTAAAMAALVPIGRTMTKDTRPHPITVFYDGACSSCISGRNTYEKLAGRKGKGIHWVDISHPGADLHRSGIDPWEAIRELHVRDEASRVVSELDAYILLMKKVPVLRPVAWFIGLPLIRPYLSVLYRRTVDARLARTHRL
jgi:predicted DCC family thiol-disulfide oxidoreductase YuxK